MAKIKYKGPINPLTIPGVGVVGDEFTPCPDEIAAEFEKEYGFTVVYDPEISEPVGAGFKPDPLPPTKFKPGGDPK